jgi:hypothetical protein
MCNLVNKAVAETYVKQNKYEHSKKETINVTVSEISFILKSTKFVGSGVRFHWCYFKKEHESVGKFRNIE